MASTVTAAGVLLAKFNLTKNWQKLKTKTNTTTPTAGGRDYDRMELNLILFRGQSHAGQTTRMPDTESADKPKRGRPVGTRNKPGTNKPGRKPKPREREKRVASLGERAQISVALSKQLACLLKGHTRQSFHHLGGVAITKVTKKVTS